MVRWGGGVVWGFREGRCDGEFRALTAWGKKLLSSLAERALILQYRLPEGRSWKRLWEGWAGSSTILFALLEHRVRKISRMEGRGAPMIFAAAKYVLERIQAVQHRLSAFLHEVRCLIDRIQTPYREKRSSASARVCSFPSWPEGPTGWGARAPNPCVCITDPETGSYWLSRRGSWECAHPVLSREQGLPPLLSWRHGGDRDSPKVVEWPVARKDRHMEVRVFQIKCCRPNLRTDASEDAVLHEHLERRFMKGARLPVYLQGAWVAFDDALEPPTTACWREGGWVWSEVDPSMTLRALLGPRDRDYRFLLRFWKKQIIHPALLRGRERCTYPLPKQFPLSLGRPSRGLLLLRLSPVDRGQDGWGGLPTPSSTAPLLKAAADAVRERGWMQGAALGDKQAGHCNRRTGGGSSCPPRQEVLDRLSLLLCSRELLGHITGCVAEEASLGYRNLEAWTLKQDPTRLYKDATSS